MGQGSKKNTTLAGGYRSVSPSADVREAIASLHVLCEHPEQGGAASITAGMALTAVSAMYNSELMQVQPRSSLYRGMLHLVEEGLASLWRLEEEKDTYKPRSSWDPEKPADPKYSLGETVGILTTAIQKDFAAEIEQILEKKGTQR